MCVSVCVLGIYIYTVVEGTCMMQTTREIGTLPACSLFDTARSDSTPKGQVAHYSRKDALLPD